MPSVPWIVPWVGAFRSTLSPWTFSSLPANVYLSRPLPRTGTIQLCAPSSTPPLPRQMAPACGTFSSRAQVTAWLPLTSTVKRSGLRLTVPPAAAAPASRKAASASPASLLIGAGSRECRPGSSVLRAAAPLHPRQPGLERSLAVPQRDHLGLLFLHRLDQDGNEPGVVEPASTPVAVVAHETGEDLLHFLGDQPEVVLAVRLPLEADAAQALDQRERIPDGVDLGLPAARAVRRPRIGDRVGRRALLDGQDVAQRGHADAHVPGARDSDELVCVARGSCAAAEELEQVDTGTGIDAHEAALVSLRIGSAEAVDRAVVHPEVD